VPEALISNATQTDVLLTNCAAGFSSVAATEKSPLGKVISAANNELLSNRTANKLISCWYVFI
jgi:hypothetical protein